MQNNELKLAKANIISSDLVIMPGGYQCRQIRFTIGGNEYLMEADRYDIRNMIEDNIDRYLHLCDGDCFLNEEGDLGTDSYLAEQLAEIYWQENDMLHEYVVSQLAEGVTFDTIETREVVAA